MEAAAIPFPNDETTPPVMKMYLAMNAGTYPLRRLKSFSYAIQILRCVHPKRFVFGLYHPDAVTILQGAKLFQALRLFERPNCQVRVAQQKIAPVDIKTHMLIKISAAATAIALIGNRTARKIDRIPNKIGHDFHYVRVQDIRRICNPLLQSAHGDRFVSIRRENGSIDRFRINQRLISLNVHVQRSCFSGGNFSYTVGSSRMIAPCHAHLSAKGTNSSRNSLIVCGH